MSTIMFKSNIVYSSVELDYDDTGLIYESERVDVALSLTKIHESSRRRRYFQELIDVNEDIDDDDTNEFVIDKCRKKKQRLAIET